MSTSIDSPIRRPGADSDGPANGDSSPERRPLNGNGAAEEDEEDEEDEEYGNGDEDDEEDEDDEDEDDEEEGGRPRKRARRRGPANPFLDIEAEVSEDEEDVDEDEEELLGESRDFIDEVPEGGVRPNDIEHRRLDRQERRFEEREAIEIAQEYKERYRQGARYTGDLDQVPQRLLMPSVNDPSLWQVRVRPGREREIVMALMRKVVYGGQLLDIQSAFERSSLPGLVYVEARSAAQVRQALNEVPGVFVSQPINLVPIDEMASLMRIKRKESTLQPGSWVRFKRGRYQGDLAQVVDIADGGDIIALKYIPRIDLNPTDEGTKEKSLEGAEKTGKKRARRTNKGLNTIAGRPPQRLFNPEEVARVYGARAWAKKGGVYVFGKDTFREGFLIKDNPLSSLSTNDIQPTLEEITRFSGDKSGGGEVDLSGNKVDLSAIRDAAQRSATAVLQPGDNVEVFEGEQTGIHGVLGSIVGENVMIQLADLEGRPVEVPAKSVRKRFTVGDQVKVMSGRNIDDTGMVITVEDNTVTFLSDTTQREVTVFAKDLRTAAEVGTSTNVVGNYGLHDFVQLDPTTVGVIFATGRDTFRVLDQYGSAHTVQPQQITMLRDSKRATGLDANQETFRSGDNMVETEGAGRSGVVLHVYSYSAFLHNRSIKENGGVFVAQSKNLSRPDATRKRKNQTDFGRMNPASMSLPIAAAPTGFSNNRKLIGVSVAVVMGHYKGHHGMIKDVNESNVRVELQSNNKVITLDKKTLRRKMPDGTFKTLDEPIDPYPPRSGDSNGGGGRFGDSGGRTPSGGRFGSGGRTPGWGGAVGRTPNPYSDSGRTPAWNTSSRTPNPYADSAKTPAWNSSSRTPNPYADGGRTPAWQTSSRTPNPYADSAWNTSARTPNPYAADGGRTPARDPRTPGGAGGSGWGRTPAGAGTSGWGRDPRQNDSWGATSPAYRPRDDDHDNDGDAGGWGAPTPGPMSAPTPGPMTAPTPGAYSAPTPGPYSAPTPGAYSAPTPGAYSAPTPGAFDAATPGGLGGQAERLEISDTERKFLILGNIDIVVKVVPDYTDRGTDLWRQGELDGCKAVVVSTLQPGGAFEKTAEVHFLEGPMQNAEIAIPVRFLEPVPPDPDSECLVLAGEKKGERVKVLSLDDVEAFVESPGEQPEVIIVKALGKLHKW